MGGEECDLRRLWGNLPQRGTEKYSRTVACRETRSKFSFCFKIEN